MQVIRKSSLVPIPWKNGGGITHEVIRSPAGSDAFRWRVSVAQIDESGPFSDFAGYQRKMILLSGNGLCLTFAGDAQRALTVTGDMAEFAGAPAPACRLTAGSCTDLNLMVADHVQGVAAWVLRLPSARTLPEITGQRQTRLAFPIEGGISLATDGDLVNLEAWDLAVMLADDPPARVSPLIDGPPPLVFFAALADN